MYIVLCAGGRRKEGGGASSIQICPYHVYNLTHHSVPTILIRQLYKRRGEVQAQVEAGTYAFDFLPETAHVRQVGGCGWWMYLWLGEVGECMYIEIYGGVHRADRLQ